jgi:hypothetical protein
MAILGAIAVCSEPTNDEWRITAYGIHRLGAMSCSSSLVWGFAMSLRNRQTIIAYLFCVVVPSPLCASEDEGCRQEFLAAYKAQAEPLLSFYQNARIRYAEYNYGVKGELLKSCEKVFYGMAPAFRLDTIQFGEDHRAHRAVVGVPHSHSFSVIKPTGAESFQLYHVTSDYDDKLCVIRQFSPVPFYLFCSFNATLNELTASKFCRFRRLEMLSSEEGERLARLDVEFSFNDGARQSGWILFARDHCWAIREARIGTSNSSLVRKIGYEGSHGEVPLVKRIDAWFEDALGNRSNPYQADVREIEPGARSPAEFTLAHFGLSDAGLGRTPLPPWFWWQLMMMVAVVGFVIFRHLSKAAKGRAQPDFQP